MIRVHGVLVSAEEAGELARRLRANGDANGVAVAERLERGLLAGVAIVGTSRPEAEVVLTVIDSWTPDRLR
jgi:hypothetical protein